MVANYNQKALIKLTESYLAKLVLQDELITFLEQKISSIRSVSKELAKIAGKDPNSIYKNKNELKIYNAIGLMRYWNAMIQMCEEYKIPKSEWPKFEELLVKYRSTLDFISIITAEEEIDSLITNNLEEVLKIVSFYQHHKPQSASETNVLDDLKRNSQVENIINTQKQKNKLALLERMKKK